MRVFIVRQRRLVDDQWEVLFVFKSRNAAVGRILSYKDYWESRGFVLDWDDAGTAVRIMDGDKVYREYQVIIRELED